MNTVELKRCPFCGGEAKTVDQTDRSEIHWFWVACSECGVRTKGKMSFVNAISLWNRREEK